MDKRIDLNKEQINELLSSSKNKKKSPNTLIMNGDIEALQALIDDGLDVNEIGFLGAPLIALAIMYSDIDIVKLLIKNGADVNIMIQDKSLLVYASLFGDIGIIKLLIENGANVNSSLIQLALIFGDTVIIKLLIENGVNVNSTVFDLPLIAFALMYGSDINTIKLLIESSADVNVSINNQPLIAHALAYGNNENIKCLIENGVNIEFGNSYFNLLELSLLYSNMEVADLCINKGSILQKVILVNYLQESTDPSYASDGYIFERKDILNIIDGKRKIQDTMSSLELYILDEEKKSHNTLSKIEEYNNDTSKPSKLLNKLHNRLNKIRANMTNVLNKMNNIQDTMTVSTIIDFIKIFIKYGGDVNYKYEDGSTALMYVALFGYEDCVRLLIENGADMDIVNDDGETALLTSYYKKHLNVVKLLIDSGADVNIIMDNGESFYKKAKQDQKQDQKQEVLEWIENSPTFIKITHDPKELVNILKSFRKDNPLKFTTHSWDGDFNKNFKENYGDFDGFLEDIKKEWDSVSSNLRQLSPNLYKKIYSFLLAKEPSCSWYSKNSKNSEKICIGWSSLKGLKEWCDEGNDPFKYKLPKPYKIEGKTITIFGQIIELFKHEVQFRNQHQVLDKEDMLEELFWNLEEELLGESFEVEYINLDKKEFYKFNFYRDKKAIKPIN